MNTEIAEIASYLPGEIRSCHCPNCYVRTSGGEPLYEGLKALIFNAPGRSVKRCPKPECDLV